MNTSSQRLDYRQINHSRMTEDMERQLAAMPTAFLALSKLRRLVGDGRSITLTGGVRGWAEWLGCAYGYPKKILAKLAECRFVEVTYGDDGTVLIAVMPPTRLAHRDRERERVASTVEPRPAEQPAVEPTPIKADPGARDRSLIDPDQNQVLEHDDAENADFTRSTVDHPIMYESCHKQQQQHDTGLNEQSGENTTTQAEQTSRTEHTSKPESPLRAPPLSASGAAYTQTGRTNETADRAALRAAMLALPEADPDAVAEALRGRPNGTLAQFQADLAAAQARDDVIKPLGLTLAAWRDGSRVAAPRAAPEKMPDGEQQQRPERPERRRGRRVPVSEETPIDTDKAARDWGLQRGGDVVEPHPPARQPFQPPARSAPVPQVEPTPAQLLEPPPPRVVPPPEPVLERVERNSYQNQSWKRNR